MAKERFYALDVFRGLAIALMILVNSQPSSHVFDPVSHSEWHGLTMADWVYPFFLFAVGNAFVFVMPRLRSDGASAFWKKIIKRSLLIFGIGLLLNWMPFFTWVDNSLTFKAWTWTDADGDLQGVRIFGVLQRIAIAYFIASILIYYFKVKGSFYWAVLLLIGYWFLSWVMNPMDPYSLDGWFGSAIDTSLVGKAHMYINDPKSFDPEGLVSSFGPIAQIIFGYLCGHYIVKKGKTAAMVNGVFVAGALFMLIGYIWDWSFPINKKIWTGSFVMFTSGLAMTFLALFTYWFDLKNNKGKLSEFFDVFGKNPLFIYIVSESIPALLSLIHINTDGGYMTPITWFYKNIASPIFPEHLKLASLLYSVLYLIVLWAIAYGLDRKRIYIKV